MGTANSVTTPAVVIRPILSAPSANQRAPSGPAAIPAGALLFVGIVNSLVITPAVVIRPILLPLFENYNQMVNRLEQLEHANRQRTVWRKRMQGHHCTPIYCGLPLQAGHRKRSSRSPRHPPPKHGTRRCEPW